jgi:hypothetical protein
MAFPLVYLVQWILGITILAILVELLSLHESVAPLVVAATTLPLTFALSRYIVRSGVKTRNG